MNFREYTNKAITPLLERIKVLEVELEQANNVINTSQLVANLSSFEKCAKQLDQAHSALKCALDALEEWKLPPVDLNRSCCFCFEQDGHSGACIKSTSAIAQIHACGIDGEAKEHPAVARVKELEVELERVELDREQSHEMSVRIHEQLDQARAILRRNLASLRADVSLKGHINQQRHDDYLEACRICGVEP